MTRTYDDSLRIQSLQVDSEPAVSFTYDDDDLLTQAGAMTLTRDPNNGLLTGTSITEGAGTIDDTYDYDLFGQLIHYEVRHNGVEMLDFVYTRDDLGRITSIVETKTIAPNPAQVKERHYEYDTAGRLYRVCAEDACATILSEYHYDTNGNRIAPSFNAQGMITTVTYDDQDRLLTLTQGPTTTTYLYSDSGELVVATDSSSGSTLYEYDDAGNLRLIELPTGSTVEYVRDGRGRTVGRKLPPAPGQPSALETVWLYSGQKIIAELDEIGTIRSRFIYASSSQAPDLMLTSGQVFRLVLNHLGSVRLAINVADGSIAQELQYDEFGTITGDSNPGSQPFGFAGGLYDAATQLVRFTRRDYSPSLARWIAKDPIGFRGRSSGLYTYVRNDPVNRVDPTGLADTTLSGQLATVGQAGVLSGFHTLGVLASVCTVAAVGSGIGLEFDVPGLFAACKVDESKCEAQLKADEATCRAIVRARGAVQGQRCRASAMQRYGNCLAGRDIGPLDAWNN